MNRDWTMPVTTILNYTMLDVGEVVSFESSSRTAQCSRPPRRTSIGRSRVSSDRSLPVRYVGVQSLGTLFDVLHEGSGNDTIH